MLMWPRGYWWNHGLNGYLAGRCFHDFSLSPYDLLRDYARHYFGPEAGPLLARLLRGVGARPGVVLPRARPFRATATAPRWPTSASGCWSRPARLVANDRLLAYRLAKVERLHTLAERLMEVHRQRDEIQRLRRAGEFDQARAQLEKARAYTDEVLALFYTLADLNQGLIERKEVPTFITANVKNWLDEEAKAIAAGKKD